MQDRPSPDVLLEAVAGFLAGDVQAAITDKGLQFRVLIAANLAGVVAREIREMEPQSQAEAARLMKLLGREGGPPAELGERIGAIREMNGELARLIRGRGLNADQLREAMAHCKQTLQEKLEVANPRFDLNQQIEQ
ncbi:MAG: hypothetical protein GMKNLPBB_01089 [Myxococcota bacterium]|nr:hypothetical protein [Myxococcota bacterium]